MSQEQSEACSNCKGILDWAKREGYLSLGVIELTLPERFAKSAVDGVVTALRTNEGRSFVLLKQTVGWKENFEGIFCCDSPLRSTEFIRGRGERAYISIENYPAFQELYVREGYSADCYEVYFDLN